MSVRTLVIPFYYGSGSGTVINYGPGSASQKVTVPTVPVPQRCSPCLEILKNHLRPSIGRNGRSGAMDSDRLGQELSQKYCRGKVLYSIIYQHTGNYLGKKQL